MQRGCASAVVVACVAWLGVEARADACLCLEGHSELVAPDLAEHPVGAPFVFESLCISGLERWSATVDGESVALVGSGNPGLDLAELAVMPTEGAEVVLTHACGQYTEAELCIDGVLEQITMTIGSADLVAPPPVAALGIDHEIGMFAELCGDQEVHMLRIDSDVEIADREPGTWAVIRAIVDGETIATKERVLGDMTTLLAGFYLADPDQYARRDVCVEVDVVDASGNASATTRECTPIEAASSGCAITGRLPGFAVLLPVLLVSRRRARRSSMSP